MALTSRDLPRMGGLSLVVPFIRDVTGLPPSRPGPCVLGGGSRRWPSTGTDFLGPVPSQTVAACRGHDVRLENDCLGPTHRTPLTVTYYVGRGLCLL